MDLPYSRELVTAALWAFALSWFFISMVGMYLLNPAGSFRVGFAVGGFMVVILFAFNQYAMNAYMLEKETQDAAESQRFHCLKCGKWHSEAQLDECGKD